MNNLIKTKTFWAGVAAIVGAAAGYATGEMPLPDAFQTGITGLLGIFLRAGIIKG